MGFEKLCLAIVISLSSLSIAGCGDSSGEFEYVAIGASDAVGVGAVPLDDGYVFRIQDGLKADGRDVGLLNLGIPGASTEVIDEAETPIAVEEKPELVTIFVGANDIIDGVSVESFQSDVNEMLRDLKDDTEALVVIATIPDLTQLPRFRDTADQDVTSARVAAFNTVIRDAARANGAFVADLAAQPIADFDISDDGFHPNNQGHQRIADLFLEVIRLRLPPDID